MVNLLRPDLVSLNRPALVSLNRPTVVNFTGACNDIDKVLQQLPLKELLNKGEADKLKEALKNGDKVSVSFIKGGNEQRFYIEANPQFKSVNIYDEHSRKITLHTALGNKTMEAMKVTHKVNEQQQQSKKNGIKIS